MNPFFITVTDIGPAICEMTRRKAACVRVEVSAPLDLNPKIIDRRRIAEFFSKALGAAELFNSSNESEGHSQSSPEVARTSRGESKAKSQS